MILGLLRAALGPKIRLPTDQVTSLPRSARKAAQIHVDGMQAALDKIGALDGIADIATSKKLPRGLTTLIEQFTRNYDGYVTTVARAMGLEEAPRPGTPEGKNCCYVAPTGVSGLESLVIFRTVRQWRDFPQVAQKLAAAAESLFKDIQAHNEGKDPNKLRMTSNAVQQGRLDHARRQEPCPLLDVERGKCRVWEQRPMVCRMHFVTGDPAHSNPKHEAFPKGVKAKNIRLPIQQQAALMQLEKRLMLQITPFLSANILLLLQLVEGGMLPEAGEAPVRLGADGVAAPKANRNNPSAKKFQKKAKK